MRSLKEELGRSWKSHDQVGNNSWEDFEEVNVETVADTANNSWLVTVTCDSYPELSIEQRSFPDEQSAQFFAREQSERIRNQVLNLQEVKKIVRNILLGL